MVVRRALHEESANGDACVGVDLRHRVGIASGACGGDVCDRRGALRDLEIPRVVAWLWLEGMWSRSPGVKMFATSALAGRFHALARGSHYHLGTFHDDCTSCCQIARRLAIISLSKQT